MPPVSPRSWSKAAKGYSTFERFTGGFADDAIAKLLLGDARVRASLPRDRPVTVLDIAAGTGAATFGFAEAVQRDAELGGGTVKLDMLATDVSDAMLEKLVAHPRMAVSTANDAASIKTAVADMTDMSAVVPDGSVDVALCVFGVMFPPDPVRALREIKRVLRPGTGVAVVVTWHYNDIMAMMAELTAQVGKIPSEDDFDVPFMKFGDEGYMRRLVRDAGIDGGAVRFDFLQRAGGLPDRVVAVDAITAAADSNPAVAKYTPYDETAVKAFFEAKSTILTGGKGVPLGGTALTLTISA